MSTYQWFNFSIILQSKPVQAGWGGIYGSHSDKPYPGDNNRTDLDTGLEGLLICSVSGRKPCEGITEILNI